MKLTALHIAFDSIKMRCHERNSAGIANENYFLSELFRQEMKMENTSVFINY